VLGDEPCACDLTGDGLVDTADLQVVFMEWGRNGSTADLNGDGVVNSGDMAMMLGSWGACP